MNTIASRKDVLLLENTFYLKIRKDDFVVLLDEEGKSNWYMQKIGYSVLRKK